jgi:AP-2 complex subunit alpha
MDMRGLSVFISEIRKCTTKEEEQKKVDKELAKIRSKFKTPSLKGYDRKKYITKLLYIYMLGYEIDFGHIEAVNLLSSDKYSEKHVGYLACTLLLHENHELVTLITNSIKRDLNSKSNPDEQCLALTAIANIGGKEQAEALSQDVQKLLVSADTKQIVRKKASLTLLNMYRKYPELLPPDAWASRVINLLGARDLGVILSVMSLLLGFIAADPASFTEAVPRVVKLLTKLVIQREYSSNYLYYGIAAPWLQVKLLRVLQYFEPPSDQALMSQITEVLKRTIAQGEKVKADKNNKSVSRVNAAHAVLFEALNVAIHYDNDEQMLSSAAGLLGKYLQDKDPNLRYLALDTMSRLAFTSIKSVRDSMNKNQDTVLLALKDPDISIRRRALDLLYSMANNDNASHIVGELLAYLPLSNYEIREELVLKVAILAEKFAEDFTWYVDVILNLITQSGDFVSEEIWHRVVQIVSNRDEDLQKYTADTVFKAVSSPSAHENAVNVAAYILGEYGYLIETNPETTGLQQFELLYSKFDTVSLNTKALLLNTFLKFYNLYDDPTLREKVKAVFDQYRAFVDVEMQQRANEYFNLAIMNNDKLLGTVCASMPPFPERESSVMKKILERQSQKSTRAIKLEKQQEKEHVEEGEHHGDLQMPTEQQPQQTGDVLGLDDILGGGQTAQYQPPADHLDSFISGVQTAPVQAKPPVQPPPQNDVLFDFTDTAPAPATNLGAQAAQLAAQKLAAREQAGTSVEDLMNAGKQDDESLLRQAHAEAEKNYQKLLISDEGTAIEDAHLQVDIKSEFHGQKGKLLISYGNKTDNPINKVRATWKNIAQLDIQASQVAPLLAPNTQVSQLFNINCLQPFSDAITLSIFFEADKKTYKFEIKLPVAVHKFIEPLDIADPKAFFLRWKSINPGQPLENQEIIKPQSGQINVDGVKNLLSSGLKLAILNNIDQNPNNIVSAGMFQSEQAQQGVLVRIESNQQAIAYRVTVRSTNGVVSSQVFNLIKQHMQTL